MRREANARDCTGRRCIGQEDHLPIAAAFRTAHSHVTAGARTLETADGAGSRPRRLRHVSIWQEGGSRECEEVWVHADSHTIGCR